jgi:hypothetical protein
MGDESEKITIREALKYRRDLMQKYEEEVSILEIAAGILGYDGFALRADAEKAQDELPRDVDAGGDASGGTAGA